jgi:acyl carrier protein
MRSDEVSEGVRRTVAALLNLPLERVHDQSSRETLEQWDSLKHMHLVLALEEEFGVEFEDDEISGLATVAGLRQAIAEKLVARGR